LPQLYFSVLYQLRICAVLIFIGDNVDGTKSAKGVKNEQNH